MIILLARVAIALQDPVYAWLEPCAWLGLGMLALNALLMALAERENWR